MVDSKPELEDNECRFKELNFNVGVLERF